MPFVYVIQGFDQGVREDIEGGVFRIGRDSSNQLQLRDSEVSRHHAEIRLADGSATVHDLGSSNGTFVNGVECKEKVLASGDRIQFGSTHLIFTPGPKSGRIPKSVRMLVSKGVMSRFPKSSSL